MKIETKEQLRTLYNNPKGRALNKVLPGLEKHSKHFIDCSPFLVLSTVDLQGNLDASPRGGTRGFVHVLNDQQILIPDAKGNNRLDSLENIIETGKVGLLFMIPGIDETLRINGNAQISNDDVYLSVFDEESKVPASCIVVDIDEVFLHCAKAFMRSKLWDVHAHTSPSEFPTMGQMLKDQLNDNSPAESREDMIKRYQSDL